MYTDIGMHMQFLAHSLTHKHTDTHILIVLFLETYLQKYRKKQEMNTDKENTGRIPPLHHVYLIYIIYYDFNIS